MSGPVPGAAAAVAAAVGVGDQPVAARSWIWAVAAGLLLSSALLAHAGWRAFCALPEPVRAATVSTIRRHPRLLAVQAGILAWTLLFVLYHLAYPSSFLSSSLAQATPVSVGAPVAPAPVVVVPSPAGGVPAAAVPVPYVVPAPAPVAENPVPFDQPEAPSLAPSPAPTRTPTPSPSPQPCQIQPATDALRQLDGPAMTLTGRALGSEEAAVAEGAAGCHALPAGWAAAVIGTAVMTPAGAPDVVTRCGDVLGQLELLRFLAPVAALDVTYIDQAVTHVTLACRSTERTSP